MYISAEESISVSSTTFT